MKHINLKKIKLIISIILLIIVLLTILPFIKINKRSKGTSSEKTLITSPLRLTPPSSVLNVKEEIKEDAFTPPQIKTNFDEINKENISDTPKIEKEEKIVKESFLINVSTNKKNTNYTTVLSDYNNESKYTTFNKELDLTTFTNSYNSQNNQKEKQNFLKNNKDKASKTTTVSNKVLPPGTIIPITLITSINSDLPGAVFAQVSQNIYSNNGELLLNKGDKVIGEYNSNISYAQNRLQVKFNKIVKNTGEVIQTSLIGCDKEGASGFTGSANMYTGNKIGASLISSLSGIGTNVLANKINNTFVNSLLSVTNSTLTGYASKLLEKEVDRQPTIIINKGSLCYMFAEDVICF